MSMYTCCDGVTRRDFIRVGAITGFGLGFSLQGYLAQAATEATSTTGGKAKAAIFVRLGGGPSHMDTFDLKPDAPDTHRGEFKPIATNVDGMQICEHLPKLAKSADKFAIQVNAKCTLTADATVSYENDLTLV